MDRRDFLTGLAVAVTAALSGCSESNPDPTPAKSHPARWAPSAAGGNSTADGVRFAAPVGLVKVPVPRGTLTRLPGEGNSIALTIDDGTSSAVLAAYADLCRATGLRATFFCNGINDSWTESAPVLRPLLEDDQIFRSGGTRRT
jgi:hypothetical protein